jgi:hypothetical protein
MDEFHGDVAAFWRPIGPSHPLCSRLLLQQRTFGETVGLNYPTNRPRAEAPDKTSLAERLLLLRRWTESWHWTPGDRVAHAPRPESVSLMLGNKVNGVPVHSIDARHRVVEIFVVLAIRDSSALGLDLLAVNLAERFFTLDHGDEWQAPSHLGKRIRAPSHDGASLFWIVA